MERQIDVHRGQQREHVSLQEDDQQLEERECDTGNDRRNTEDRLESAGHEEEVVRRAEEQHQQDVAGQHVGHETNHQRERAQDEGRDELDGHQQEVQGQRDAGNDDAALDVLEEAVLLDSHVVEHDVGERCEYQRHTDSCVRRDVQEGNDAGQVAGDHDEEDRRDDRQEALALFLAQDLLGDVDTNEVERELSCVLQSTGNQSRAAHCDHEEGCDQHRHQQTNQHQTVELEGARVNQHGGREKIV